MLRNAIRLGDTTSHGGRVVSGNPRYMIFGKPVACVGDTVLCPLCKMPTVIVEGDRSWSVDGRNVAVAGCKTSCGAVLIPSQGNVFGDRESSSMATIAAGASSTMSAETTPIVGNETAGILKRYANAATADNAFPEHLTAADEKGLGSKIRDIYGGNDTVQNQADIAAYNDKKSALGVTHGQIFNASEKAVGVLGVAEGGLALSKLAGAGKSLEASNNAIKPRWDNAVSKVDGDFGNLPTLRQAYVQEVYDLQQSINSMRAAGTSTEDVAKFAYSERVNIKTKYRASTPPDILQAINERNMQKYGNEIGPTFDDLVSKGKSYDQIIDSATRTGGGDLF